MTIENNMEDQKTTYEDKKQEKEEQKNALKRQAKSQKLTRGLIRWGVAIIVVGLLIYGIYVWAKNQAPQGPDHSVAVEVMDDNSHYSEGTIDVEYNSNPPTSGPHYALTARSGFREEEIPDGHIIHNLEHGDIWISFHPDIDYEIREELKQFTAAKVIITPRSANDTDIALAAWGRLDKFDLEDVGGELPIERINDFIKRYMHQGPEYFPGASGGI